MESNDPIKDIAGKLKDSPRVTILTGAGISAGSGVSTFRGEDGFWKGYSPQELASPQGFREDPERVWEWYDDRRQNIAGAEPNPAHEIIGKWSRAFENFQLITQNTDDLHERVDTHNIIKFHGSLWHVRCWDGCAESPETWEFHEVPLKDNPPSCPHCDGLIRPDVVWFGESLDPEDIESARKATNCDLFFTIGTSAEVHPAAGFISEAARSGACTVEINPDSTAASDVVDYVIQKTAEAALQEIEAERNNMG